MADRPLHIAIDGRELVGRRTGVGRYLFEIMKQWAASPRPHRYTVVMPADPSADLTTLGSGFDWRVVPDDVGGTWWEQMRLPGVLAQLHPDALFAPGYTAPLRARCPVVLAVYDVSFCAHPEWFSWREGIRRRRLTRTSARRAHRVITISEFSRGEIHKYLGVPLDRMIIAAPGAPATQFADGARPPVVLYVGSLFNRRHIPDMIQGFAEVANSVPAARMVIVGDNRTTPRLDPREVASRLGIGDRVDWREYVTDAELHSLYHSARAFVFLSDYEGFGMTPLEALAHGVPSVLLDTEISREVYADSAVRVAADSRAIANGLTSLLVDGPARDAALAAGRRRLGAFSWTRSADLIADALAEAAG